MFRMTIKEIVAKKVRLLSTAIAVIIGVAFLAGTLIMTDTVIKTFDSLLADANSGTDAYVRVTSPSTSIRGGGARHRHRLVGSCDRRRCRPSRVPVSGTPQILDKKARPSAVPQRVLLMNWCDRGTQSFPDLGGRAPQVHGDRIDQHSATPRIHSGDRTTVLDAGCAARSAIVGSPVRHRDSPGGSSVVLFDDASAQMSMAEPGRVDGAAFIAKDGVSQAALVANMQTLVGDDIEVITGAQLTKEDQDHIHDDIASFGMFMMVFAGIAMFVGAFIINNTFSIIVRSLPGNGDASSNATGVGEASVLIEALRSRRRSPRPSGRIGVAKASNVSAVSV